MHHCIHASNEAGCPDHEYLARVYHMCLWGRHYLVRGSSGSLMEHVRGCYNPSPMSAPLLDSCDRSEDGHDILQLTSAHLTPFAMTTRAWNTTDTSRHHRPEADKQRPRQGVNADSELQK